LVVLARVGVNGDVVSSMFTFWFSFFELMSASVMPQWLELIRVLFRSNGSLVVPVTVPAQLSIVVGVDAVALHWPVTLARVGVTGGVVSSMITFLMAVVLLPLPSLYVQWITWVPWVL